MSRAAAQRIASLERQVAALLAKVEAQAAEISELKRRLGENSSNSSKPPSSDSPAERAARPKDAPSGRRPGGQPGHPGKRRERLPANQVTSQTDCFPPACRRCGDALPKTPDADPLWHQVIDVPPIAPSVDEFLLHRVTCRCGATTCGTPPTGTPAGILGPGVLALIGLLIADCHVSRRKTQRLLHHLLGIKVSLGALSESEETVSDAVANAVDEARLHAMADRVKHVDATTWSQAGSPRALWTMATAAVTVFFIATDGTRAALRTWLNEVRGVLVSDRGSQFGFWAVDRRQICWAHLIRTFAAFAERRGRAGELGTELLGWSRTLLHVWHRVRDGTMSRADLRRVAVPLRAAITALLEEGTGLPGAEIAGACRNMLAHEPAMWTFVDVRDVEPTNNHAERELRGFVLWRKVTCGSRSDRGDRFAANLKSVVHTCRKQGRAVLPYLAQAIRAALHGTPTPSLLVAAQFSR